ncbi:MAG: histidine phosphatase family protein [Prolixibacteraceae bacterium]|jgi:phosphohistidine phosphatase|nr:histidine phosphatase family protein [Prolixibacteraceae bacterium]
MKRLVIIRHAKTEHSGYDNDFQRELTERGIGDAESITKDLNEWKVFPDKIISSPATRAITTAKLFATSLGYNTSEIEEIKGLYFDYSTQDFLDLIQNTNDEIDTLFIVGHNPFMHFLSQNMSKLYDGHTPTCSTVVLDFEVNNWNNVEPRQGLLFLHLYPKLYK